MKTKKELWYQDGLAFECKECGCCCTGAPGYVWVTNLEIDTLAARLNMDADAFERRFVKKVGRKKSLIDLPNGDCILFDHIRRNCRVYEDRPIQCRTWPFWSSNLESEETWLRTSLQCPGCNRGAVIPLSEILERKEKIEL